MSSVASDCVLKIGDGHDGVRDIRDRKMIFEISSLREGSREARQAREGSAARAGAHARNRGFMPRRGPCGGVFASRAAMALISGRMKKASLSGTMSVLKPNAFNSSDTTGPTDATGVAVERLAAAAPRDPSPWRCRPAGAPGRSWSARWRRRGPPPSPRSRRRCSRPQRARRRRRAGRYRRSRRAR